MPTPFPVGSLAGIFVLVVLVAPSSATPLFSAKQAPPACAPLVWTIPPTWYGLFLQARTYNATECDRLVMRTDLYRCIPVKPWIECASDDQCPKNLRCASLVPSGLCVSCDTQHIANSTFDYANITLNVTESMLRGSFWNTIDVFNHTGVDLRLTLERWVWSPNMKVLLRDTVEQKRLTWHAPGDGDFFNSGTDAYERYNSTHIRRRWANAHREAYDGGEVKVTGSSGEEYYLAPP